MGAFVPWRPDAAGAVPVAAPHIMRGTTVGSGAGRLAGDDAAAFVRLANNSACRLRAEVVARNVAGGDAACWSVAAFAKRGASASAVSLVGIPAVTKDFSDLGAATWGLSVVADTANGGVALSATGAPAATVRWIARVVATHLA